MLRSKLLLPLALLFLLLLPAPMSWGDEFDEETAARTVSALLSRDPDDDVVKVWALSESLADGGKPAIKALREAAPGAAPAHRLAIARALILLEDYSEGLGMLRKLVEDESVTPALKVAALKEIGIEGELEDAEWLEEQIDVTLDPAVKMAMAKSLWYLNFTNKKKGKEVLLQYMRSTDPDLRAEGALALGEIGAAGEAKAVLLDLRNEPTERGRSAAFLLKILNLEAIQDQGLREPPPEEPPGATAGGSSKWPLLDEVMSLLGRYYLDLEAVDRRRIEDAMASGITKALDPFTNYLSEEEHALLLEGLDPTYGGVGAYVFNDPDNKERFTISRPIFGGPIYRAGLRTGDIILSIDGTSTDGLAVEECVRLLKGPPGTDVTITVARIGWPDNRDFTLTRARITIPTTAYDILPGDIGFLQIHSFSSDTAGEVEKVLDEFERREVQGILIDVRYNGGGYLQSAVEIASLFLPQGTLIVSEKGRTRAWEEREHRSTGAGDHRRDVPIAVLINQGTASAAEILAGALHVHGKARLIGTMSFGKGSVQMPVPVRSRPGEAFDDVPRDVPQSYTDLNGNGRPDPGEPVSHASRINGRYDPPEKFEDANGNARWDEGESFTDENLNGVWDDGETFTDTNGNGLRDPGASLKLTVAAYYLPDGRNLRRQTEVVDGITVTTGGLEPDVEAEPHSLDLWEIQAQRELEGEGKVRAYVDDLFESHPDLLRRLARSDRHDPGSYPGFQAFYDTLDTRLDADAVRLLVRYHVRRHIGDDMGRELVGDVVDDLVVQAAVRDLLEQSGREVGDVEDLTFLNEDAHTVR